MLEVSNGVFFFAILDGIGFHVSLLSSRELGVENVFYCSVYVVGGIFMFPREREAEFVSQCQACTYLLASGVFVECDPYLTRFNLQSLA